MRRHYTRYFIYWPKRAKEKTCCRIGRVGVHHAASEVTRRGTVTRRAITYCADK
jgi:hypothetical protein